MNEKSNKKNQQPPKQEPAKVEEAVAEDSALTVKADLKESKGKENKDKADKDRRNKESKAKHVTKKKHKPVKEKQPISKIAILAFMIAMLVSVAVGYEFFILNKQGMLTAEFSKAQKDINSHIANLEQDLKNTKIALNTEMQARKNVEDEFSEFKKAMEAVASKFGRTSNEWRLAEAEYLLSIANHRLALAHDRITAIAIFETADQRLKLLGDPALLKIRKSLKEELTTLQSIQEPDLPGMVFTLGSLVKEVDRFPLVDKERVATATGQIEKQAPESWKDIPAAVWNDIKSLVVVRRHEQPTEPLLPPDESWFLYQNLRLKLEQARLALLQRDTALFRQHLTEADTWISTFFNEESTLVINALKKISTLSTVELAPVTPDVSSSLRQLRQLLIERGVKIGK